MSNEFKAEDLTGDYGADNQSWLEFQAPLRHTVFFDPNATDEEKAEANRLLKESIQVLSDARPRSLAHSPTLRKMLTRPNDMGFNRFTPDEQAEYEKYYASGSNAVGAVLAEVVENGEDLAEAMADIGRDISRDLSELDPETTGNYPRELGYCRGMLSRLD